MADIGLETVMGWPMYEITSSATPYKLWGYLRVTLAGYILKPMNNAHCSAIFGCNIAVTIVKSHHGLYKYCPYYFIIQSVS